MMIELTARKAVAPAYLFLCLLLGGSAQGVWGKALLQVLAVLIIAWSISRPNKRKLSGRDRHLFLLLALAITLCLIQILPLPSSLQQVLPGRQLITQGRQLLGLTSAPVYLSLAPFDSLTTSLSLLPPLAMALAMLKLRSYSTFWLAAALIAGCLAGVVLGIMQVSSPLPEQSPWYLYKISNFGVATGFFANSNHMASLLLVTIPFVTAIGATLKEGAPHARARVGLLTLAFSVLLLVVLGIVLNKSLAGYGLGVPVLLASVPILFGLSRRFVRVSLIFFCIAGLAALAFLWSRPVTSTVTQLGTATSVTTRRQIATHSLSLAAQFAPVGSGLGTFAKVYPLSEDPREVTPVYVNHAHNDYLELAIEMGVAGILIIFSFLLWWVLAVIKMLRSPTSDQYAMAGAVSSAAILLHSVVDYPLRTTAISVVLAMCLALILHSRRSNKNDNDLRPTRHVVID